MAAFKERELHVKYKEEIKAWFVYLDQKRFGKELERKMLKEVDRFMATKESTKDLIERVFGKTEWVIEFIDSKE